MRQSQKPYKNKIPFILYLGRTPFLSYSDPLAWNSSFESIWATPWNTFFCLKQSPLDSNNWTNSNGTSFRRLSFYIPEAECDGRRLARAEARDKMGCSGCQRACGDNYDSQSEDRITLTTQHHQSLIIPLQTTSAKRFHRLWTMKYHRRAFITSLVVKYKAPRLSSNWETNINNIFLLKSQPTNSIKATSLNLKPQ